MNIVNWGLLLILYFSQGCKEASQSSTFSPQFFTEMDTNYHSNKVILAKELKYNILFRAGDSVLTTSNSMFPSKDKFDFMAFIKGATSNQAYLWVNHETAKFNDHLGDGGGASLLTLALKNNQWQRSGSIKAIDFSSVGGTFYNCLGTLTPWGTVLTAEEGDPTTNVQIYKEGKGIRDTSDFQGYKKFFNYGWMVEVEVPSGKVLGKRWQLGRFMHEGAYCMPDNQTVYLLDDFAPGVFFKFVAKRPKDLTEGQLFAYRMNDNSWLPLPMQRDSLNDIRNVALKRGATIFIRLEDIELAPDGTFLLTETGIDSVNLSQALSMGAKLAPHLNRFHIGNQIYKDYHGRILNFNPQNNEMKVWLEGGVCVTKPSIVLSNPDNISIDRKRNRLIIHEDLNATTQGRQPSTAQSHLQNEIFILDLNQSNPQLENLKRVLIAPAGSETTGGVWDDTFSTYFVNIQHPDNKNPQPFDKDITIAITGW